MQGFFQTPIGGGGLTPADLYNLTNYGPPMGPSFACAPSHSVTPQVENPGQNVDFSFEAYRSMPQRTKHQRRQWTAQNNSRPM
jgi:hypothetical protein